MYCTEALKSESAPCVSPVRREPVRPVALPTESNRTASVLILVLWTSCLTIGALGFALPYAKPQPAKPEAGPVQATFLNVELSNDPLPQQTPANASLPIALPPLATTIVQPPTAQPVLVAEPSSAIVFALPINAAANVTDAANASYAQSNPTETTTAPAVQTLTFGRGECRQPAPEYPLAAKRQGQQGAVKVRFTVGSDGRVLAAEPSEASPWPMLNDSAIRTIRQRWKFAAGSVRVFEVAIHFQLNS